MPPFGKLHKGPLGGIDNAVARQNATIRSKFFDVLFTTKNVRVTFETRANKNAKVSMTSYRNANRDNAAPSTLPLNVDATRRVCPRSSVALSYLEYNYIDRQHQLNL